MKNQAKITGFRKVANDSYQMELTQIIDLRTEISSGNLLGEMNKGDDRFKATGPKGRKAWTKVTPEYTKEAFGIDISQLSYDANGKVTVNIDAPKHINGMSLVIKVTETTNKADLIKTGRKEESIDLLMSDPAKNAKHTPASETREAFYFVKDGLFVYSLTTIEAVREGKEVEHVLITDADLVPESELFAVTAKIADTIKA